ncbi:MAG: penicillin acylase family protein, partial [Bdellovibrionales bacterium]|nr:penicillin acylase family protein [Bdellovibrionales bacterium]
MAEVIGERGLNLDRSSFQIGFDEVAKLVSERQMKDEKFGKIIEAYVAGVNARADQLTDSEFPTEYRKLGVRPRRFTALDIIRISYSKNMVLTDPYTELRLSRTHAKLPPDIFNQLFPWLPRYDEPAQVFGPTTGLMPNQPKAKAVISLDEIARDPLRNSWVRGRPDSGSNAWVVSADRTSDGSPIIANDYHIHFHLPGLYMPMALNLGGRPFLGATIPGQPGVSSGTNGKVGFGFVAALVDTSDWYRLKTNPGNPNEYLWNGKFRSFDVVKKSVKVRGGSDVELVKRVSVAGPMIPAIRNSKGVVTELAYRWAGREGRNFLLPSLRLPFLESAEECGKEDFVINLGWFVFTCVDSKGRQGVWVTGRIPKRKLHNDPRLLSPATSDEDIWQEFIEPENNPSLFPVTDFIGLGNQKVMSNRGPYYLGWNFSPPVRALRMNSLFSGKTNLSLEDVANGQADIEDSRTELVRGKVLKLAQRFQGSAVNQCESRILDEVAKWDGRFERESYQARLFNSWLRSIHVKLWRNWIGDEQTFEWPNVWRTVELLTEAKESSVWKPFGGREMFVSSVLSDICKLVFRQDASKLEAYQWQLASRPMFKSLTGDVHPEMDKLRVAGSGFSLFSQTGDHGTVFRWIAKVSDPPEFRFSSIGGVDGDPDSIWSTNWSAQWSDRELFELVPQKGNVNE